MKKTKAAVVLAVVVCTCCGPSSQARTATSNTTQLQRKQACQAIVIHGSHRVHPGESSLIIDHIDLTLYNELMHRTKLDTFSNKLDEFQQLLARFQMRAGCAPFDVAGSRALSMTREEIHRALDECLCRMIRLKLLNAIATYFKCDLEVADKDSLHAVLSAKANRFNVFARYRVKLFGGADLLRQYDALVDRCFHEPLRNDDKQQVQSGGGGPPHLVVSSFSTVKGRWFLDQNSPFAASEQESRVEIQADREEEVNTLTAVAAPASASVPASGEHARQTDDSTAELTISRNRSASDSGSSIAHPD